ncbi:MAG: hypothetical protein ACRDRM_05015 [Pseudonocardiaceae bacterium]
MAALGEHLRDPPRALGRGGLAVRKVRNQSRRTVVAESQALLLAMTVRRSAFCSSVIDPGILPVVATPAAV